METNSMETNSMETNSMETNGSNQMKMAAARRDEVTQLELLPQEPTTPPQPPAPIQSVTIVRSAPGTVGNDRPPVNGSEPPNPQPDGASNSLPVRIAEGDQGPARILVAADLPIVRFGLAQIVNANPDLVVCGEADTPRGTLDAIAGLKPTLVLLDITPPGRIELIEEIAAKNGQPPVLAFSTQDNLFCAERALSAGAQGYIMKDDFSGKLAEAIRKVVQGSAFVSQELLTHIVSSSRSKTARSGVDTLSKREFDILRRIGQGRGTRQIAEALDIKIKTVETHRAHMKEKLHLKTAPELACFAAQWEVQAGQGSCRQSL
jgi:DNA-binding NarL/FixJ family response regulator